MLELRRLALPAVLSCVMACGGKTTTNENPDGAVDGATDSTGDGIVDTPSPPGGCPAALPASGAKCTREGLVCAYGDDPRPDCRALATCTGGVFSVAPATCPPLPPTTCPPTREEAAGKACAPSDAYCGYAGIPCHCTNCDDGPAPRCEGPTTWHCKAPNPDPKCPPAAPNLGTACSSEGQECQYGCGEFGGRTCKGGVWVAKRTECPVSSRNLKTDIVYLDDAELSRVAAELRKIPLATYDYKDPALAGRRRLGLILEDNPGSPAVDTGHGQVDLYGYTSMAVAALQVQAKKIDALEKKIDRLEKELAQLAAAKKH